MIKISAVIITFNEEEHLDKCLKSVLDIADEIIVIDSFSTDSTKTICNKYKVNFIEQEFLGYKETLQFLRQIMITFYLWMVMKHFQKP